MGFMANPTQALPDEQVQLLDAALSETGAKTVGFRTLDNGKLELVLRVHDVTIAYNLVDNQHNEEGVKRYGAILMEALNTPSCADIWERMDSVAWN